MNFFKQLCAVALFISSLNIHSFNVFQAIRENNQIAIQEWLDSQPNLEIRNSRGYTPLIQAVVSKRYEMVCWLLNAGAHKYAVDIYGNTAYDYAIALETEVIKQRKKEFALALDIITDLIKSIELHNKYMYEIEWLEKQIPNFKPNWFLYYPIYKHPEFSPISSLLK